MEPTPAPRDATTTTDETSKKKKEKLLMLAAQLREGKREYRGLFEELAKAKAALRGFRQNKQQVLVARI